MAIIPFERCGPMTSNFRLTSQLAAAIAVAGMLSMAAPAMATELAPGPVMSKKVASSPIRHHASRNRVALHRHHQVPTLASHLGCSGEWCGRQFVLMIGIGF
jgi:hypothetical protein